MNFLNELDLCYEQSFLAGLRTLVEKLCPDSQVTLPAWLTALQGTPGYAPFCEGVECLGFFGEELFLCQGFTEALEGWPTEADLDILDLHKRAVYYKRILLRGKEQLAAALPAEQAAALEQWCSQAQQVQTHRWQVCYYVGAAFNWQLMGQYCPSYVPQKAALNLLERQLGLPIQSYELPPELYSDMV